MPSVLSDHDKETVKRLVPKSSNKIQAVAVARLYVVPPGRGKWTYTGLQGAAVLSNDLVGNTFWIKLVDISPANRGVIWDQEIYDTFQYNQDRTFFHSFELEQCMAALSFVDEKEARQFKKKMDEREKNASKATKTTPFGSAAGGAQAVQVNGGGHKSHGLLGGLFGRNRNSSNPPPPQPAYTAPQPVYSSVPTGIGGSRPQSSGGIDLNDPALRPILDELVQMGITEDQISQNADFIKGYIEKKQAEEMANGIASALPSQSGGRSAPPPPPPSRLTPENTGSTTASRRGAPPAPPPSRRPAPGRAPSPPRAPTPERTPSPPPVSRPVFRAPPPLADAGKFAQKDGPLQPSPGRPRASSGAALANPGPPPPPRPPKEADDEIPGQAFRVPPPFSSQRQPNVPPPPPSRGPVPPPPPSRDPSAPVPPPPPSRGSVPPPPPSRANAAPVPPPLPPASARPIPPPPSSSGPPPPPLPPMNNAPPPPPLPPTGSGPLPPPPMPPSGSGPPPPPLPPGSANPPPLPSVGGDRGDLLAAIRGGGTGGLRKVKPEETNDRSAAAIPGTEGSSSAAAPAGAPATPSGDAGGLAGALQAALNKRKQKVSGSDDEKDDDDDW